MQMLGCRQITEWKESRPLNHILEAWTQKKSLLKFKKKKKKHKDFGIEFPTQTFPVGFSCVSRLLDGEGLELREGGRGRSQRSNCVLMSH